MRSRPFVLALVLMTIGASFAHGMWTRRDYTDENMRIVPELPAIEGTDLVKMKTSSSCRQDTCMPWYRYWHGMSLDYRVDTESVTQQEVIDAFKAALGDWHADVNERCANADPSFCDKVTVATFSRGRALVGLNFLNWRVGRFTVGIDARSE